jgi:signal transduction histidine kinase
MAGLKRAVTQWLHKAQFERLYLFALFLLSLVSLIILGYAAFYLARWPDDGVSWSSSTAEVDWVNSSGPAAGVLQRGDVIIDWDGFPLNQNLSLYSGSRPGDPVEFTILRNGQENRVKITLAAPTWATIASRLEPLFIALAFWMMGIGIWAFRTARGAVRLLYGLYSLTSCNVLVFGALSTTGSLWTGRLFYLTLWFLGPLLINLHQYFPRTIVILHQRLGLGISYGLAAVAGLFSLTGDVIWIRNHWFHIATLVYLAVGLTIAIVLLVNSYRRATSVQAQQEIRLVMIGAALALIPFTGLSLLPDVLFGRQFIPVNVSFLFFLTIPCSYGYAIVRYRLIRLDRYVGKNLVYFVSIVSLITIHLLIDAGLELAIPTSTWYKQATDVGFILVVVVAFIPLYNRLQKLFEWALYGGWYNYHTVTQSVGQVLDQVTHVRELADRLPRSLKTNMKLECACLLLRLRDSPYLHNVTCANCPMHGVGALLLEPESAVSQYFRREQGPVTDDLLRERLARLLPNSDEQRLFACALNRLWVPLVGHNEILGVLVLGPKRGDDLFDSEDIQMLKVVARQVSVIIQNAALLTELQQRAVDMERLHQQLLRAREEERKRLARELHDETIQALVSLNYDLSRFTALKGMPANEQADSLQQQVHQVMGDLRRICSELRPPALDSLGLVSALRSRLRELGTEGTLQIELTVEGDEKTALPEELGVCLYRVLQEALSNIQKHARAARVSVKLELDLAAVRLSVQDDGCGFMVPVHLSQFMDDGHFGLAGMCERLDLLGGKLTVSSMPGRGTCLEARVPLFRSTDSACV